MQKLTFLLLGFLLFAVTACDPEKGTGEPMLPSFDRQEMLTAWADDVILPGYEAFTLTADAMVAAADSFANAPDRATLTDFRAEMKNAYVTFQSVSPFIIGRAEEIRFREQANTYPTDVELINANLTDVDGVNFDLPSQTATQGFPALDFLLHVEDGEWLLGNSAAIAYAQRLAHRISDLGTEARDGWRNEAFRDAFVMNDGNSATASIDRVVNDYLFHYEKFLRAGKVGIPAGVFSDDPLADRAESLYGGYSKTLFRASFKASRRFFADQGLAGYLDALDVVRDGEPLSTKINDQFAAIEVALDEVGEDFGAQVTEDNTRMLLLFDEMQRLVVLLKVDMLQALSINVDYVDADGD